MMDYIKFYTSENIPLPALIPRADTQELKDELLIRQLNLAFNAGRKYEIDNQKGKPVSETKPKTVTVSIELPEPPEWYGEIEWRQPSRPTDMYLSCNMNWQIMGTSTFTGLMFVARKLHKFPAIAAKLDKLNGVEKGKE